LFGGAGSNQPNLSASPLWHRGVQAEGRDRLLRPSRLRDILCVRGAVSGATRLAACRCSGGGSVQRSCAASSVSLGAMSGAAGGRRAAPPCIEAVGFGGLGLDEAFIYLVAGLGLLSVGLSGMESGVGHIPADRKWDEYGMIPVENGIPLIRTKNRSTVSRPAPVFSHPVSRPVTGKNRPVFV
jgi:hypothetical protein